MTDGSSNPDRGGVSPGIRTLHEGRYLRLMNDSGWEYVERMRCTGVVAIVAITPGEDGPCIVLVEQPRQAVHAPVIELPAGLIGDEPGAEQEPAEAAAHRELAEETGFEAERMIHLTKGPSSAGAST